MKTGILYRTIRRGKQRVTSAKQVRFLHIHRLPHTEVRRSSNGNVYRVRRFNKT